MVKTGDKIKISGVCTGPGTGYSKTGVGKYWEAFGAVVKVCRTWVHVGIADKYASGGLEIFKMDRNFNAHPERNGFTFAPIPAKDSQN